jgi:hypothetical protein
MADADWMPGDEVRAVARIEHADPPVEPGTRGIYHRAEWTPHPHGLEIELLALVEFGQREVHCRFEEIEHIETVEDPV